MVSRCVVLVSMIFLFLLPSAASFAQDCHLSLQGHIMVSGGTGNAPAGDASIYVPKWKKGVKADSSGMFLLRDLCPGKIELVISYAGYKSFDTTIRVLKDLSLDIVLTSDAQQLSSVVVTGAVIHKDQITTAVKSVLSGRDLEQTRGLSLGESLKSITGVNSLQTGPSISKPIIHGVYSNRILIMNNGVRQEGQNWGNDHAPEIDPFIATKVTVVKGAASIRYGSDAIGGVILLDPKELRTQKGVDGELNLVGMTNGQMGVASGMVEGAGGGKWEGFSWRAQGTIKKAGNAQTSHYYLGNTGFNEDDYSATLQYRHANYGAELYYSKFDTKIGIASATHIGTLADLYEAFARNEPAVRADFSYDIARPYQTVNHQLLKASSFINWKGMGRLEATYAFQNDIRKEYDADVSFIDSIARLNLPDLYFKLYTNTADLVWQHPAIGKHLVGSIGLNYISHGNSQENLTGYTELIPNFVDYGGGAFAIEKYELNRWVFEAGVRYDYKWLRAFMLDPTTLIERRPTYNWGNTSVNAGATYRLSEQFSATANFGSAWRPPQAIELFANGIHQSAASYETGDSALQLEKAYNTSAAIKYSSPDFDAEVGIYVNDFHNYIYLKPDSVPRETIQGAFPSFTYTQIKNALFKGLDLNFTYRFLRRFSLISKTTLVRARDITDNSWLVNIPADRFDNTLRYEIHSLGKVRNFFISINNLVVARQSRVSPNSDYVAPPPGYVLWGADIGCSIPFFNHLMNVSLSGTNLANTAYRDYLNRFRYFIDDLGRNVSLRVVIPFGAAGRE
ncbi:MAG TPA: TonB-dependent receptor [Puia sp.]|nr:TonB-dependent receptor [Puia sp.]